MKYINKLNHQYKRTWAGYITPSEACDLIDNYGALVKKQDEEEMRKLKDNGEGNPRPFYFNVRSNSELEVLLNESRKRKLDR